MRFGDAARAIREQLEERHFALMGCEVINRKLASHIGKYDGLFARLCVLWHAIEETKGLEVSEDTARRVADFMHRFLLPHATAFYTDLLALSKDDDVLADVAGYILARKLEHLTNRDIARGNRVMGTLKPWEVNTIFEQLEALGWLIRVPSVRFGAPPRWQVNPVAHRRFAARAQREAAAREQARALLREMFDRGGDF